MHKQSYNCSVDGHRWSLLDKPLSIFLRRAVILLDLKLPDESRDKEEVVVVHPDDVSGLVGGHNSLGKGKVCSFICGVELVCGRVLGRDILPEKVVEERPEGWTKGQYADLKPIWTKDYERK